MTQKDKLILESVMSRNGERSVLNELSSALAYRAKNAQSIRNHDRKYMNSLSQEERDYNKKRAAMFGRYAQKHYVQEKDPEMKAANKEFVKTFDELFSLIELYGETASRRNVARKGKKIDLTNGGERGKDRLVQVFDGKDRIVAVWAMYPDETNTGDRTIVYEFIGKNTRKYTGKNSQFMSILRNIWKEVISNGYSKKANMFFNQDNMDEMLENIEEETEIMNMLIGFIRHMPELAAKTNSKKDVANESFRYGRTYNRNGKLVTVFD